MPTPPGPCTNSTENAWSPPSRADSNNSRSACRPTNRSNRRRTSAPPSVSGPDRSATPPTLPTSTTTPHEPPPRRLATRLAPRHQKRVRSDRAASPECRSRTLRRPPIVLVGDRSGARRRHCPGSDADPPGRRFDNDVRTCHADNATDRAPRQRPPSAGREHLTRFARVSASACPRTRDEPAAKASLKCRFPRARCRSRRDADFAASANERSAGAEGIAPRCREVTRPLPVSRRRRRRLRRTLRGGRSSLDGGHRWSSCGDRRDERRSAHRVEGLRRPGRP